MAKYGQFKYGQEKYGVEPTPIDVPIGGTISQISSQSSGVLGTRAFGIGNHLFKKNYMSADAFIDNILK